MLLGTLFIYWSIQYWRFCYIYKCYIVNWRINKLLLPHNLYSGPKCIPLLLRKAFILLAPISFWPEEYNNKKWALVKMLGDNKENCHSWCQIKRFRRNLYWILIIPLYRCICLISFNKKLTVITLILLLAYDTYN